MVVTKTGLKLQILFLSYLVLQKRLANKGKSMKILIDSKDLKSASGGVTHPADTEIKSLIEVLKSFF